jgi:hypothetical protein
MPFYVRTEFQTLIPYDLQSFLDNNLVGVTGGTYNKTLGSAQF